MLCTNCNKNEATKQIVALIGNTKTVYNLCDSCSQALGIFSPFAFAFANLIQEEPEQLTCSKCNMTLSEFKRTGLLGCEHCYEDFIEEINPIINKVQKSPFHIGRRPQNFEPETIEKKELTLLEDLQNKLKEAIDSEDFEHAAILRDEIKTLKGN